MLALFFAAVALLLASIGLYGVFNYSVLQRRREIGIRIAVGASPGNIMRCVISGIFAMVLAGGLIGIGLGLAAARYIDTLLYHVKPTAPGVVLLPSLVILVAAVVASITPVLRAVRLDPVATLRVE
jgi:ABC-type antimicrobial peptide transport system permease subunit